MTENSKPGPGKKQALVSSFFAPRTKKSSIPAVSLDSSSSKRKLDESTEEPRKKAAVNPRKNQALLAAQRKLKYNYRSPDDGRSATLNEPAKSELTSKQMKEKEELHSKFLAKLGKPGSIEAIKRGRYESGRLAEEDLEEPEASIPPESDDESPFSNIKKKLSFKSGIKKPAPKKKLTPMEQQYVDLKRENPNVLLVVEVGYKYRFFGEDARTASKELSMFLVPGRMSIEEGDPHDAMYTKFASTSFPVQRLSVHVKRLVDRGYKVGVVNQMETAALKAAGDNRNAPFERKLAHLYTKGTYLENFEGSGATGQFSDGNRSSYLFAICEQPTSSGKEIGIVAVESSTGDIIYDSFEDTVLLTELETRLLHIQPCEILLVGEISSSTKKLVLQLSSSQVLNSQPRIEVAERLSVTDANVFISQFYTSNISDDAAGQKLDYISKFSDFIKACIAALIIYLKSFKLEHVLDLTKNFTPFSSKAHMFLNGNTITSLELFQNQTDYKSKGSLFWVMDHTRTPFGQRLLKKWIGSPLIDREAIEHRVAAVTELKTGFNEPIQKILNVMRHLPDLEKGLIRIYFQRCSLKDMYYVLNNLNHIGTCLGSQREFGFKSEILNRLFEQLSACAETTTGFLSEISKEAALSNNKAEFFLDSDRHVEIEDEKMGILAVEEQLKEHLLQLRKQTKLSYLQYSTTAGIAYQLEVKKLDLKKVPHEWIKLSQTKAVSRFRSPEVIKLVQELDKCKEQLEVECDKAFLQFIQRVMGGNNYEEFRMVVQAVAQLDCLMSLATVASQPHYVQCKYVDEPCMDIKQGRHPMVEQILLDGYVPNDCNMSSSADSRDQRALILTGPNMGGKSSYVRQLALIAIMAQVGSYVPADSARIGILDAVYTRMGAYDNIMSGESTFKVELKECGDIMKSATDRSLVILDEIGRGTGTMDGVAIAHAVLAYFVEDIRALTLFVTHYPSLAEFESIYPHAVKNYHMGFIEQETSSTIEGEETEGKHNEITFLYTLEPGTAHKSYGLNVARLARIPDSIIQSAQIMSSKLEHEIVARGNIKVSELVARILKQVSSSDAQEISEHDFNMLKVLLKP